jgi:multidrug efflux pump subunit AcrB
VDCPTSPPPSLHIRRCGAAVAIADAVYPARTPTDIFPAINIPVVSILWNYTGLSAVEMEQRMVYNEERALTTTVNNIEHIESTSYNGIGVIKVFFRQGTSVDAGVAQITAVSQTVLRSMPPGTTPPLIIQYNASTVPILQYGVSGKGMSEQEIFDVSVNQIRVGLITVQGAAIPWPYGGKQRLVSVDLDLKALQAQNLSPEDVVNASTPRISFCRAARRRLVRWNTTSI